MKTSPCLLVLAALVSSLALHADVYSQSVKRARGTAATAGGKPAGTAAAVDPAAAEKAAKERAAIVAAQAKRNQKALVGADERVVEFLKKRVEDGSADAPLDLAKRYEEGKGVTADAVEARKLYKLAAERGNEEAKVWLKEHPEPPPAESKEK